MNCFQGFCCISLHTSAYLLPVQNNPPFIRNLPDIHWSMLEPSKKIVFSATCFTSLPSSLSEIENFPIVLRLFTVVRYIVLENEVYTRSYLNSLQELLTSSHRETESQNVIVPPTSFQLFKQVLVTLCSQKIPNTRGICFSYSHFQQEDPQHTRNMFLPQPFPTGRSPTHEEYVSPIAISNRKIPNTRGICFSYSHFKQEDPIKVLLYTVQPA